jgi:hypothetical protein
MRSEAESHSEDDRRRMEEVESRNRLDGMLYQAEKMVRENREKIAEADLKAAEEAIEDAKKAIAEGGTARLRSATEKVERSLHKIAELLYKANEAAGAQQAGAASAGASGGSTGAAGSTGAQGGKPGDVIDAEYVDVDETKRERHPRGVSKTCPEISSRPEPRRQVRRREVQAASRSVRRPLRCQEEADVRPARLLQRQLPRGRRGARPGSRRRRGEFRLWRV